MVLLVGGYPVPWGDAKAWALHHCPGIDIYDDHMLPGIIRRYYKKHGKRMDCIAVNLYDDGPGVVCFFVIHRKHDSKATPLKYTKLPPDHHAQAAKKLLFGREDDRELASRVEYRTVADPYEEYYQFRSIPKELKHRYIALSETKGTSKRYADDSEDESTTGDKGATSAGEAE